MVRDQSPDWVLDAIERSYEPIVALHGPAMLPSSPILLGAGAFGCVLPTHDPAWVCKVSIDGSEAFLARAQAAAGLRGKGVCEYLEPVRTTSPAGPLWIMWRRAVGMPNFETWYYDNFRPPKSSEDKWDKMMFGSDRSLEESLRLQKKWTTDRGLDGFEKLGEVQQAGMTVAFALSSFLLEDMGTPADFSNALRSRGREAASLFNPVKKGIYWCYTEQDTWDDSVLTAAIRLLAYRWLLERLHGNILVGSLARALTKYLDRGLVLADCQPDNLGMLDGDWTLFDGGFTVPIHPRWDELWMQEGIRTRLWTANDRIDVWQKLGA